MDNSVLTLGKESCIINLGDLKCSENHKFGICKYQNRVFIINNTEEITNEEEAFADELAGELLNELLNNEIYSVEVLFPKKHFDKDVSSNNSVHSSYDMLNISMISMSSKFI